MKVIGLISGGKDSIYNMVQCVKNGHQIICLGHLSRPSDKGEMDSYMYQTVGSELADAIAECMNLPLLKNTLNNKPVNIDLEYTETENDEVEDLYSLLKSAKQQFPELEAVSSGAILSRYQKNRVENICSRLNLTSLTFLWERNQSELLNEMIQEGIHAVLIKTCAMGLSKEDLMKSLEEIQPKLVELEKKFQINVCGEGGEYESLTLDSPLFNKKISITDYDVILHSQDIFSPVYYVSIKSYILEDK